MDLQYLAGVVDGDGCIHLSKKGFMIQIINSDEQLLNIIQKNYGGSIREFKTTFGTICYVLKLPRKVFWDLIPFLRLKPNDPKFLTLPKESMSYSYLAGLIDSDGHITVSFYSHKQQRKNKEYKCNVFQPVIQVTQKETLHTIKLMEAIIEFYPRSHLYRQKYKNGFSKGFTLIWVIKKRYDLKEFSLGIDPFLIFKKDQNKLLREAISILNSMNRKTLDRKRILKLISIREKLSSLHANKGGKLIWNKTRILTAYGV